jgi:hypothetical protein
LQWNTTEDVEVTVEERKWHRLKKPALLSAVGFAVLALISGFFAYESAKGRGVTMKRGAEAAAVDRMAVPPPIDVRKPGTIETATFALG